MAPNRPGSGQEKTPEARKTHSAKVLFPAQSEASRILACLQTPGADKIVYLNYLHFEQDLTGFPPAFRQSNFLNSLQKLPLKQQAVRPFMIMPPRISLHPHFNLVRQCSVSIPIGPCPNSMNSWGRPALKYTAIQNVTSGKKQSQCGGTNCPAFLSINTSLQKKN
jgi:hypothetical protein